MGRRGTFALLAAQCFSHLDFWLVFAVRTAKLQCSQATEACGKLWGPRAETS